MAEGGAAPPSAAMRGKGVSVVVTIVIAVALFLVGIGAGYFAFRAPPPPKTTLVVGTNVPFPPFEDFNSTSGEFVGFDIDIAALVAKELNWTFVVRQYSSFPNLLGDVGVGNVDLAVAAITMSGTTGAGRNSSMAFSNPYYNANQGVLARVGSAVTCVTECTVNDLKTYTIGVQQATTSLDWANKYLRPNMTNPNQQIVVFERVDTEIAALKGNQIDAVIIDLDPAKTYAGASNSGLRVAGQITTGELYGIAVAHGDPLKLLPVINRVLANIRANGVYSQLIAKWFA